MLEVLIAVTIIALAAGPLLGALVEALSSSSEGRSLATIDTVLKGFAETATSEIQQSPSASGLVFNNCQNVTYGVLSLPTPRVVTARTRPGRPTAAVTVFGIGFLGGISVTTFSVTVGGHGATIIGNQSQLTSGTEMGNMQLTFRVPKTLTPGSYPISVTESPTGHPPVTITSTAATDLTVTPAGSTSLTSPVRGYTLGVTKVRYWSPGTSSETSPLTDCVTNGGLQLLTLHARAASGVSDTLTFALRDPSNLQGPPPTPTFAVHVSATPVFTALPGATTPTAPLKFTATVTPAGGPTPPPTRPNQPVTWTITAGGSSGGCPTSPTMGPGTDNTEVYTCTVQLSSGSAPGTYVATAVYTAVATVTTVSTGKGFARVYGPDGAGSVSVTTTPSTVTHTSTGNILTFTYTAGTGGMYRGEVTMKVPTTGNTPNKKWTPPKVASGAGHTTATIGTTPVTVVITPTTANTIVVTGVTLPKGGTLVVTYGAGGGTTGVKAPKTPTTYTFVVQQASIVSPTTSLQPVGAPLAVTVT